MEVYLRLSGWTQCNQKGPYKREAGMSETERRLAMEADVVMCYGKGEGTVSHPWADQPLKHFDNGNLRVARLYKLSFFCLFIS